MKIRVVKTASEVMAVQVEWYHQNKRFILLYDWSALSGKALNDLLLMAEIWIKDICTQMAFFQD
ncbi:MAG: hypothetical protein IPI60_07845 [Saprospiraceae bacterium]|nr:hypothetical protein [Saprospiraceae bacterium]